MKLHHVGIVVGNLDKFSTSCERFLNFRRTSEVIEDPIQQVRIQFFLDPNDNLLEVIEPAGPASPVAAAAAKGGGLNHLCFEVSDIEREVETAVQKGAILVGQIVPAVAFSGRRVAFLFVPDLQVIELVESGES